MQCIRHFRESYSHSLQCCGDNGLEEGGATQRKEGTPHNGRFVGDFLNYSTAVFLVCFAMDMCVLSFTHTHIVAALEQLRTPSVFSIVYGGYGTFNLCFLSG